MNYDLAYCAGLWMAEGDNKSKYEITFTNNCPGLIKFFHKQMVKLFPNCRKDIRLYIYSPNSDNVLAPINVKRIKRYTDIRARKPYFIWRLASIDLNRNWKTIVFELKKNKTFYNAILCGFFAGEGNIKTGSHSNRTIRIAQGKPLEYLELILNHFTISYKYSPRERSYVITWSEPPKTDNKLRYFLLI